MEQPFEAVESPKTSWAALERPYRDRAHAGAILAGELEPYREPDLLVLALPRGGVPVAAVVASTLGAELDVMVVRKLGVPGHSELAMGAIASGDVCVMNPELVKYFRIPQQRIMREVAEQGAELGRQEAEFRGTRAPARVAGRTVILVDDGIATGATMRAALVAVRARHPRKVVVASPVASAAALEEIGRDADELVCPTVRADFSAVGDFYGDFAPVTTATAQKLLELACQSTAPARHSELPASTRRTGVLTAELEIPVAGAALRATLSLPRGARGIVVFAHGTGSSRFSPRNRFVARVLESRKIGTLLLDLLTVPEEAEELAGRLRLDLAALTDRLVGVVDWTSTDARIGGLPLALFGSSTGAAAAVAAAAERPGAGRAVISRGGRPDLAGESLRFLRAPTLLIVGDRDAPVLALNRAAALELRTYYRMEVVPGATHLFEEAGKLEAVAQLSAEFLEHHLTSVVPSA
jgi:putative phosphoribosyl transferase